MSAFHFSTEITVRFAETDAGGIAHHSAYLVWFEVARVAYLTEYAGGYQALRDQGIESPVVEMNVRYLSPARFDEKLRVHARISTCAAPAFAASTWSSATASPWPRAAACTLWSIPHASADADASLVERGDQPGETESSTERTNR